MPDNSIYEHDNEAFNIQEKSPVSNVIQKYDIPVPVKLDCIDTVTPAQNIMDYYKANNTLQHNDIVNLSNMAKGEQAFTPVSYYIINNKYAVLKDDQIKYITSKLQVRSIASMLAEIVDLDPIVSTLPHRTIRKIKDMINDNSITDRKSFESVFNSLPNEVKKTGLSFLNNQSKEGLASNLSNEENALDRLLPKQRDLILSKLLHAEKENGDNIGDINLRLAKYPREVKDTKLKSFDASLIKKELKTFYDAQFQSYTPDVMLAFIDGSEEDLDKYSEVIEAHKQEGKRTIDFNSIPGMTKFFEKMTFFKVDTKTREITLFNGTQANGAIALPGKSYGNDSIGSRLIIFTEGDREKSTDGAISDYGDKHNKFRSVTINSEACIDNEPTDVYSAMHFIAHANKLKHFDEMFFKPDEKERLDKKAAGTLKGLDLPSLNPANVNVEKGVKSHGIAAARAA